MTLAIFIAYISEFPILNTNPGVAPDVRYLSPVYLPLNLIGLLILSKFPDIIQCIRGAIKYFMGFTLVLIPVFVIIISINKHQIEDFYSVFFQVSFWISIIVIFAMISSIFLPYLYLRKNNRKLFIVFIGLIIALPFIWQIMTNFMIANMANSYAGYTFWIPIVVHVNHLIYTSI